MLGNLRVVKRDMSRGVVQDTDALLLLLFLLLMMMLAVNRTSNMNMQWPENIIQSGLRHRACQNKVYSRAHRQTAIGVN